MKTPRFFSSLAGSMWVVAVTLVGAGNGPLQAAGAGVGSVGAASAGGHAGAVSTGGAHVSTASVGHGPTVTHSTVAGSLRPFTATYAGTPRYLPGGFTPNVFPHQSAANLGVARNSTAPATAQTAFAASRNAPVAPAARVHNAWSDPASTQTTGQNHAQSNFTGQILYPDATHDAFGNPYPSARGSQGGYSGRTHPFRFRARGNYNPYLYGDAGVLIGGYAPYYYGDTVGSPDISGDYAGLAPNTVGDSSVPSPAAQNDLSRPYPSAQMTLPAGDSTVNPADTDTAPTDQSVQSNTGPDSLVEAVQAELARRGYFGGKVDAIYNPATHTAIQRFQADQHLPASGRINEATLHALQLD